MSLKIESYNRIAAIGALALIVATATLAWYGHGEGPDRAGRPLVVGRAMAACALYVGGMFTVEALLRRTRTLGILAGTGFTAGCAVGALLGLAASSQLRGPSSFAYLEAAFGLTCGGAVTATWVIRSFPTAALDGLCSLALTLGVFTMTVATFAVVIPDARRLLDAGDQVNPVWRVMLALYISAAIGVRGGLRRWPRIVAPIIAMLAAFGVLCALAIAAWWSAAPRALPLTWAAGLGLTSATLGVLLLRWALDRIKMTTEAPRARA